MKTIKTQNVSIPVELHDWVTKKMEETKLSTPWAKASFSSIVEHALSELRKTEEQGKGFPQPHNGGKKAATSKTVKGSESSVGGSSTATSKRSLKTG